MSNEQVLTYRLPLTWVRIVGTRTELNDELQAGTSGNVECNVVVTTEVGADPLTRIHVDLTPPAKSSQKLTWTLTADGRLSGADVSTTRESLAAWKSGIEAASFVFAAGSPLLAAGPPGWLALAGGTAAAGVLAGAAATHVSLWNAAEFQADQPAVDPEMPEDAELGEWGVDSRYAVEFPDAASALANYRAALGDGQLKHSRAVRATLKGTAGASDRVREIERVMRSVSIAGALAEATYEAWKQGKITRTSSLYDARVRIDTLPCLDTLRKWCKNPTDGDIGGDWVTALRTAVTVDFVPVNGDNQLIPNLKFEPTLRRNVVDFRPPRPAVVRVWKLVPRADSRFDLHIEQTLHTLVNYPGNETTLQVRGSNSSTAMTASFDENGALTKLTGDGIDPALQRAHEVSALFPAATAAAESGQKLRSALAPPTLSERAADLEAAKKLGLVPTSPDPNQALKDQIELERLRAQLSINRQLATATSPALVVHIEGSLE